VVPAPAQRSAAGNDFQWGEPVRVIAVTNQKGGVGKTTTTINTAAALARLGKRVLAVDLDPQAHLTYSLGVMAHEPRVSVADCLVRGLPLAEAARQEGGISLVPAALGLAGLEQDGSLPADREQLLARAVRGVRDFDFILIDCPPNLGLLTVNALAAAGELLIPMLPEFLSMQSLGMLPRTVGVVRDRLNPGLGAMAIVLTRFQKSRKLHREVMAKTRGHFGGKVCRCVIGENISLAEAPSFGQDIFRYKPDSAGARNYQCLAREILSRRTL